MLRTKNPSAADDLLVPYAVFQAAVNKAVTHNLSGLMEQFPGNHYFFICRTYADNNQHSFNTVQARRIASAERQTRRRSPRVLEGATRKGKDNFKRAIKKMLKDMPLFKSASFTQLMNIINMRFQTFVDKKGNPPDRFTYFVNDTIRFINQYVKKQFTIDDIRELEPTFITLLSQTQKYDTALCFVANDLIGVTDAKCFVE